LKTGNHYEDGRRQVADSEMITAAIYRGGTKSFSRAGLQQTYRTQKISLSDTHDRFGFKHKLCCSPVSRQLRQKTGRTMVGGAVAGPSRFGQVYGE